MKIITSFAATCALASALAASACVAQGDPALETDSQAVITPCHVDCDCPINDFCSISAGATAGYCAPDVFGPHLPGPTCFGSCQCGGQPGGPYCVDGVCSAQAPIVPVSGLWWNPALSGESLGISSDTYGKSPDLYGDLDVMWFTYMMNGTAIWYGGTLKPKGSLYTGGLYEATWAAGSTLVGSMTLATTSATTGTLSWVLNGKPGSQPLQRFVFGGAGATPPITGRWYPYTPFLGSPTGELPIDLDLFFDVQGSTVVAGIGLYDAATGLPTWVYGSAPAGSSGFTVSLLDVKANNLYPGSVGAHSTSYQQVGSLAVQGINAADSSAKFALTLPASYLQHVTGTQSARRLTD